VPRLANVLHLGCLIASWNSNGSDEGVGIGGFVLR
jgi:hypothetical protein